MILGIAIFIIFFSITFILVKNTIYEDEVFSVGIVLTIVMPLFVVFGIGLFFSEEYFKTDFKPEKTYDIINIKDINSVSGNFFLGSGSINGTMKYIFYYKEKEYIKLKQIDYRDAVIRYSKKPKVTKWKSDFKWVWYYKESKTYYEINIPEGTIKQNYILDGE
jgi:hypothetical protein